MTLPPTRAQIMEALEDLNPNPLADRVTDALDAYARAFEEEAHRRNSPGNIRLPAPTDEAEAFALDFFLAEVRAHMPHVKVTIKANP